MLNHHRPMLLALAGVVLAASLTAVRANAQSGGAATPAPAPVPAVNPAPPVIHYHFHLHGNAPTSSMYPNYAMPMTMGTLNSYYPSSMLPSAAPPTPAQPNPVGYLPGPFAPAGFQNMSPTAPPAQGVIHVFLPTSDAVVYLNGQQMRGKGKDRKFTTPVLAPTREFQYWVTASFPQGGETVTQYRKVIIGAGEYTVADFTRPPETNPIRLPAGPVDPNSVVPPTPE